ncbi:hypothetical protein CEXT_348191 [Caerostris extrusa]|uniref:Uncharacterized protein n=1 Tax=Caerostris extrusa TaxID=172846 RepID=A0AAV4NZE9_CAEEX|nr:hypothetical protein CEXT_348191 [Caerostris extrusa]
MVTVKETNGLFNRRMIQDGFPLYALMVGSFCQFSPFVRDSLSALGSCNSHLFLERWRSQCTVDTVAIVDWFTACLSGSQYILNTVSGSHGVTLDGIQTVGLGESCSLGEGWEMDGHRNMNIMPGSHGVSVDGVQTVALGESPFTKGRRDGKWMVIVTGYFRSDDFTILRLSKWV